MATRPNPGICVHCLRYSRKRTWDHVFPLAWYPSTTPQNIEKWKIPACEQCNKDYGRLEEDLLFRLAMCIPPETAGAAGIVDAVLRSVDPAAARNERDRRARAAKRARVRQDIVVYQSPPSEGVVPGLGVQPGVKYDEYATFSIPPQSFERLGEKIVRGLTFIHHRAIIGPEYRLGVYLVNTPRATWIQQLVEQRGSLFERGPGISVFRAEAGDDPVAALYRIMIWGRIPLFAAAFRDPSPMAEPGQRS